MTLKIRDMSPDDWDWVREIYQDGISTGHATFETEVPEWTQWDRDHLENPRLVAESDGIIQGWAALSPVSGRCVYSGVAEVSVYVRLKTQGQGIGKRLLNNLIDGSERNGIWTLQAGVFPENSASLHMHQQAGFREVGRRERIGKMKGVWRDVLMLERRSDKVGIS